LLLSLAHIASTIRNTAVVIRAAAAKKKDKYDYPRAGRRTIAVIAAAGIASQKSASTAASS
jgi:DUF1009 family protein